MTIPSVTTASTYPGVQAEVRSRVSSAVPSNQAMLYRFMGPRNDTDTSSKGDRPPLTHTSCNAHKGDIEDRIYVRPGCSWLTVAKAVQVSIFGSSKNRTTSSPYATI